MTTNNHTAIVASPKQAANAATFNSPLGELDAAMGAVSTLTLDGTSIVSGIGTAAPTTTAQTLVGAINEHEAQIGAAASVSGTIGTSIDTDGTLKAGAVDVAAVLASNVVTSAKILDGALPSPNLAFDPYNRYIDPAVATLDGQLRLYARTDISRVDPDASNPYGLPTLRVADAKSAGLRLYLADCGLKVGDVLSFGILAYVPTGANCRGAIAWRNAAGASLGTASTGIWTGNNTTNWFQIEAQTVPATCVKVDLYISYTSGTGVVDCYYWYMGRAERAMLASASQEDDGRRAMMWLEAAKGSMTSLDERLDVSLGADGTIGSANNLAFDPINRYYAPTTAAQDGRLRWYNAAKCSQVTPDANNPYNMPTIRVTSAIPAAGGGKRLYLDEMGIRVDSTGASTLDYVSIGLLLMAPATLNFYLAYATRALDPSTIVEAYSDTANLYTGTGALQLVTWDNIPMAADGDGNIPYSIDVYPYFHSGTGDIDIYGTFLVRGSSLQDAAIGEGAWDGQRAEAWLQASTNSDGTLKASVAVPNDIALGVQYLHDWQAQLAKIRLAASGEQAVIAVLGDSWVNGAVRLVKPLRALLQAEYGDAGVGWVGATVDGLMEAPTGATRAQAGTWDNRNIASTPKGRGPDLCEASSTDDVAAVGSFAVTATMTDAKIHYLKQPDGATFRWQTDSDGWNAVDSAAVAEAYTVISITGLSNASHVLTIEVVDSSSAGHTAGLVLFGVDTQITGNGARVHKLGMSGSRASHWAAPEDATLWADGLTALAPNLCIICLGTNDDAIDVVPATYIASIETLVTAIRAALPLCDILYLSPAANTVAGATYTMADYVTVLRISATDNDYAMFDSYQLLGAWADADARGLYTDGTHINETGGRVIIGRLCRDLLMMD